MTCPHCQWVNPADARFCTGCRRPLALLCPACQTSNALDSRFCKACGTLLLTAESSQPVPRSAPLPSYTSRYIVMQEYLTRALEIFERLGTLGEPDKVKQRLAILPEG
jgi:predicted amidophosphoribosyltransferase